ncbi:DgyrCDS8338 [Dimorphilus gyrociliatus]|uniref:DgyrCDS8338 n=1 Tax=Dimorphilus gyrociliatus TaxID=2664684 RepID=A0A7I8VVJ2_9ANNE|nr:DgyrCDS8338 [Dimorphilus gyrociliatus]
MSENSPRTKKKHRNDGKKKSDSIKRKPREKVKSFRDVCLQSMSLESVKGRKKMVRPPSIGLRLSNNKKTKASVKEKSKEIVHSTVLIPQRDYRKVIKADVNSIKRWSRENKLPHMLSNQLELLHKQIIAFRHIQMSNYLSTRNSPTTLPEEQKNQHQNHRKLSNAKSGKDCLDPCMIKQIEGVKNLSKCIQIPENPNKRLQSPEVTYKKCPWVDEHHYSALMKNGNESSITSKFLRNYTRNEQLHVRQDDYAINHNEFFEQNNKAARKSDLQDDSCCHESGKLKNYTNTRIHQSYEEEREKYPCCCFTIESTNKLRNENILADSSSNPIVLAEDNRGAQFTLSNDMGENKSNFGGSGIKEFLCRINYPSVKDSSNRCSFISDCNYSLRSRVHTVENRPSLNETNLDSIKHNIDGRVHLIADKKKSIMKNEYHSDLAKAYMNLSLGSPPVSEERPEYIQHLNSSPSINIQEKSSKHTTTIDSSPQRDVQQVIKDFENKRNSNNNSQPDQTNLTCGDCYNNFYDFNQDPAKRYTTLIPRKSELIYNECSSEFASFEKVFRPPEISKSAPDPRGLAIGCFHCSDDMRCLKADIHPSPNSGYLLTSVERNIHLSDKDSCETLKNSDMNKDLFEKSADQIVKFNKETNINILGCSHGISEKIRDLQRKLYETGNFPPPCQTLT